MQEISAWPGQSPALELLKVLDDEHLLICRHQIDILETNNREILEEQSIHEEYLDAARSKLDARSEFCEDLEQRVGPHFEDIVCSSLSAMLTLQNPSAWLLPSVHLICE